MCLKCHMPLQELYRSTGKETFLELNPMPWDSRWIMNIKNLENTHNLRRPHLSQQQLAFRFHRFDHFIEILRDISGQFSNMFIIGNKLHNAWNTKENDSHQKESSFIHSIIPIWMDSYLNIVNIFKQISFTK